MPKKYTVTNGRKLSDILNSLVKNFDSPRVSILELVQSLSHRSYGVITLLFALPMIIPIPTPGLSALLALPLVLVTFQQAAGLKAPWLPNFIATKQLRGPAMRKFLKKVIPYIKRVEFIIKPRLKFLVEPPMERVVALLCFFLSLLILLPIPFGNAVPAFAIVLFALAILMHDGLFVIFGLIIAALSAFLVHAFLGGVIFSVMKIFGL
jgi:hypothetical protein